MAHRWLTAAAALVAGAGCAAIVGLSEPSDVPDDGEPDVASVDAPSTDAAPPDAGQPVDIGFGSGRDGPLVLSDKRPVNDYAPLAKKADIGARSLLLGKRDPTVTTQPVKPGDVLIVLQSATPGVTASYDVSPLDSESGTFELVYVNAVNGDTVDIGGALTHAFTVPGSQVVRVAQPSTVEIAAAGGITCPRWDGITGGVIAVLAKESMIVNGSIEATGQGFRGGKGVQAASPMGCSAPDGLVDAGFALRGEGTGNAGDAGFNGIAGGRGNAVNGGGGGDCHNSGGGGGGNGGRGANGGWSNDSDRPVGGMGGAALRVPEGFARLRFGGGGGAGEENEAAIGSGGSGGGVVFIRTPKLTGTGTIYARGNTANTTTLDGAGGGGAGGTIYLDVTEPPTCGRVAAVGGGGGNSGNTSGPGGGGAGGLVFIRGGVPGTCLVEVNAGASGKENALYRGAGPLEEDRTKMPWTGLISSDVAF